MTDADSYSRPERFTERVAAKRYRAAIQKQGECMVCMHRDPDNLFWGRSMCKYGTNRVFPQCKTDDRAAKFTVDAEAVQRAMQGVKRAA